MDHIDELLTRGVANIIPGKAELKKQLASGKKLHIYLGIDPTSTKIHLGHAVALRKLQAFANLGHHVSFLIGDFTALIGDTSDKDTERPVLTSKQIEENFQTYKKQAEKIIDFSKVKVVHNSTWLKKLSFEDIVKLTQHFSVGDFAGRELIKKRLSAGKRVGLHEFLYPVMQGYDSYILDTDIQIGGTDQTFNMQSGRTLQKILRQKESFVLTNDILEGTDGRKMSKSWGNAIWLGDSANDMFRKLLSINDQLILTYAKLASNYSLKEIELLQQRLDNGENPLMVKRDLAKKIVNEFYDDNATQEAELNFVRLVKQRDIPANIARKILVKPNVKIRDFIVDREFVDSKSEAKRQMIQGGVTINEGKITDIEATVKAGILRVGKPYKKQIAEIVIDES